MSAPDLHEYEVVLRASVRKTVSIRATSPHEAAALVRDRYKLPEQILDPIKFRPDDVRLIGVDEDGCPAVEDEWSIYSACEACERPLFETDDIRGDDEVDLCLPCYAKAVEAAREEGSQ